MSKVYVGYDNGNGNQDVCSNHHKEVIDFPSVTGEIDVPRPIEGDPDKKLQHMTVKKGMKHIGVGECAINHAKLRNHDVADDKYTTKQSILLAHTAVSLVAPEGFSTVKMVLGLPYYKMNEGKHIADSYKGMVHGLEIGFYGKYTPPKTINIEDVEPVPQHYGAMFDLTLDDNGEIANKDLVLGYLAIYDIGYKTNMGAVFHRFNPVSRHSIHSKNGMHVAFDQIARKIGQFFNGLEVKAYDIPSIIRGGGKVKGHDVTPIINEGLYDLAVTIVNEIKARWGDAWEITQMAFTGGGAVLLKPYLEQAFQDAKYGDNKQNANGLRKFAVRKWGRTA